MVTNFSDMRVITATIAVNASESEELDTGGRGIAAVLVPTGWTTAALSVQAQVADGGTFYPVYLEDGTEVGIASANMTHSRLIYLPPDSAGVGYAKRIKIRSGLAGAAVNQSVARTLYLVLRGY